RGRPQQLFQSVKALEDYWTTIGRFDHTFNDNDWMFVRVHRDFWEEDKNRTFANDVNGIILNRINRGIMFDEVHMFGPTFILNTRYGFAQQEFPERRTSQGFDLASLGFSPQFVSLFPRDQASVPNVMLGSVTALSGSESGDGVASSPTIPSPETLPGSKATTACVLGRVPALPRIQRPPLGRQFSNPQL
ncbi:MAG: hypothetical protein WKF37_11350, partial [Bryobacteraceae bacterium]